MLTRRAFVAALAGLPVIGKWPIRPFTNGGNLAAPAVLLETPGEFVIAYHYADSRVMADGYATHELRRMKLPIRLKADTSA